MKIPENYKKSFRNEDMSSPYNRIFFKSFDEALTLLGLRQDLTTAKEVSPLTSYHIHEFEGVEYYMPEGLEIGVTRFHGDYQQQNDGQEVSRPAQQIEPEEPPSTQRIEPEEPPPIPEQTYTPPPPSTVSRGGGS